MSEHFAARADVHGIALENHLARRLQVRKNSVGFSFSRNIAEKQETDVIPNQSHIIKIKQLLKLDGFCHTSV